ncbi:sulfite exporter TauE/SafE family protein [Methanosarcina sp. MSH10X1]|uniref:sulfite exporter TauE/SafE family protein n=1 Tax=Methanosarcina sp. MSH10X1 TaxID=2507075 RepID=UPI000FFB3210|nr:sulfite exporter TauE/SafE family protein [Methanosarcina sp. MSH10X1]RXA17810.1 sulfite exporter TauE/SafE family protein [Methanosarcina sp. MSH10X1]
MAVYEEIMYITLLTLLASLIGTLAGFGISTIMIPILLVFLPLPQTLLLVAIIHWFNDIWKIILFREGIKWKLFLAFGLPGIFTSFLGSSLSLRIPREILSRALGLFLIAYVLFILFNRTFKLSQKLSVAVSGGALTGFFAGIFGIGGEINAVALSAFNLEKAVYVATAGAISFMIDSTRIATYVTGGVRLDPALLSGFLIFVPASLIGALLGKKGVEKIPQEKFRNFVAIFIFLLGLKLVLFP